jgi:hypothetical protein
VQFQVQSDSVDDLLPNCLAAEVLYGDTQLDPARISVTASPATGAGQSVRVVTTVRVDEPVVTVHLRVGCQQKLSKRYTLFAELPISVVEPVAPKVFRSDRSNIRSAPGESGVKPVQGATGGLATAYAAHSATTQALATPVNIGGSSKVTVKPQPPVTAPMASLATKKSGVARLKLDPLDLLMDRDPVLRASGELLTVPQEDGAKRAEAAALWRSLNVSPEQMLQDEANAAALEKDIQSLFAATTQNQKGLIDLQGKVQQAESERYANWLVYSLTGLWVVSLVTLLWLWRRKRTEHASAWLHEPDAQDSVLAHTVQESVGEDPAPAALVSSPKPSTGVATPADVAAPATAVEPQATVDIELEIDLDLGPFESAGVEPAPDLIGEAPPVPVQASAERDFFPSSSAALRACESAEMVDVREEAEFFVSVGQHDKAIDILTARVAQFGESSPLVCLDLLRLYHALGREAEFEMMRAEFNHWFSGNVPEFWVFGDDGRSLEQYPQIMKSLSALWPSSEVLDYIEGCLYRQAAGDNGVVVDLQAYLDLLLLHGVAKQMVRHTDPLHPGNKLEALRVPARTHAAMAGDASQLEGGEAIPYRAGAQRRGSQFGALKYPPTTPPLESTTDLTVLQVAVPSERNIQTL